MTTLNIKSNGSDSKVSEITLQEIANFVERNISGFKSARNETVDFIYSNISLFEKSIVSRNHSGTELGLSFINEDELFNEMESKGYKF